MFQNIEELTKAVKDGKNIYWHNPSYKVIFKDDCLLVKHTNGFAPRMLDSEFDFYNKDLKEFPSISN